MVLLMLISEEWFGFVEGSQILDNVIHTHEIDHSIKSMRKEGMIIQLELSKA